MGRRAHERSLSYPTEGPGGLESSKSLESQYSLDSQASLRLESQASFRSKRSFQRSESSVNLRTGGRPPTDRRSLSPGPLARALSAQHSATTVNYGGIGALPLYKAYSQSVDSSLDCSPTKPNVASSLDGSHSKPPFHSSSSLTTPEARTSTRSITALLANKAYSQGVDSSLAGSYTKAKDLRKDAIVQQSLRIRAAKAWLLQRWPLCVAALLLLALVAAAALQFRSDGMDMAAESGQQSILASTRGPQSIQQLPRTLRNNMAQLLSGKGLALRRRGEPLGVCIMTADFWGLRSAGGTATAYHLLAQALAATGDMRVTFLAVTRRYQQCQEGVQAQASAASAIQYKCLAPEHFVPGVVETYPYESLSHAALAWLKSNLALCDVVHVHEWGGVFVDVTTASAYRQLKPGLRVIVETHGGHFWSTQGSVQRPLDVTSLRIDAQERMGLQLADALISPTHYMTAFLRERAWRLPKTSLVIPNVLPPAPPGQPALKGKVEKPVWRLAFFSRLEERKGLKVFVSAVKHLQEAAAGKLDPRFEVIFVGADSRVDMRPSSEWLKAKTASWKVPVKILPNVERSEALELLDEEGTLLVMCSLIDNMPYVLAEAAVKGVPLISFDVGGIGEMLEYAEHEDVIVTESSAKALSQKLQEVLERGKTYTVQLSNHMLEGRDSWLKWHRYYAKTLSPKIEQEDLSLMIRLQRSNQGTIRVVHLAEGQQSVALHDGICGPPGAERGPDWNPTLPMLLLPAGYQVKEHVAAPALMSELLLVGKALDHGVGALSFGVELAGGQQSFPTGPTWHLYTGDDSRCMESVPLLLRKSTFCGSFFAHARVFRVYQSWVLIMMLRQAGLRVHTYPEVLFRATNLTASGGDCNPDKAPIERHISFGSASNILGDPEEVMTNLYLAPFPRPATSLIADYPYEQGHKGWQVGYRAENGSEFRQLVWHPSREPGAKPSDGTWGCPNTAQPYPAMHHSLVHPCTSTAQNCCGLVQASFDLRFQSFFAAPKAMLLMAYDMWPICGDGLTLQILHTKPGSTTPEILMNRRHPPGSHEKPQRQKVEVKVPLHVGDLVDFIVDPHTNMDCDGVYIVDMQFWPDSGDTRTWES